MHELNQFHEDFQNQHFFLGVVLRVEVDKERLWDRPEEAPE